MSGQGSWPEATNSRQRRRLEAEAFNAARAEEARYQAWVYGPRSIADHREALVMDRTRDLMALWEAEAQFEDALRAEHGVWLDEEDLVRRVGVPVTRGDWTQVVGVRLASGEVVIDYEKMQDIGTRTHLLSLRRSTHNALGIREGIRERQMSRAPRGSAMLMAGVMAALAVGGSHGR